jgi:hypothetical protein
MRREEDEPNKLHVGLRSLGIEWRHENEQHQWAGAGSDEADRLPVVGVRAWFC